MPATNYVFYSSLSIPIVPMSSAPSGTADVIRAPTFPLVALRNTLPIPAFSRLKRILWRYADGFQKGLTQALTRHQLPPEATGPAPSTPASPSAAAPNGSPPPCA